LSPEDQKKFDSEFIFEWEIEEEYVVHALSLRTLLDRGLCFDNYTEPVYHRRHRTWRRQLPSTSDLRTGIAEGPLGETCSSTGCTQREWLNVLGQEHPSKTLHGKFRGGLNRASLQTNNGMLSTLASITVSMIGESGPRFCRQFELVQ
jgi:hypothetical protein